MQMMYVQLCCKLLKMAESCELKIFQSLTLPILYILNCSLSGFFFLSEMVHIGQKEI